MNSAPVVLGPALALALAAGAAAAQQQPGAPPAVPPGRAARADTADSVLPQLEYRREVFRYTGGSRDPFMSLITSSEVRPTIDELRLVSVVYDARFGNSVAVVRETGNPRPHRLRRGDVIGRLRVVQIRPYEVVFQIEEFGFERQQVLTLQRPGEVNR